VLLLEVPQTREAAQAVMNELLEGQWSHDQVVQYLRSRPIMEAQVEELLGYRDALWQRRKQAQFPEVQLDIVGTGGVKTPRYNTSTTCAIILSALGVRVAKHGNRGSRSANGAFDFLEAIGLPLDRLTQTALQTLESHNLAFLFARDWHPAFKALASARAEVGQPTVFNLLGPLLNPAAPSCALVGCSTAQTAQVIAEALGHLGIRGATVMGDGLDEITLAGQSRVYSNSPSEDLMQVICPADFGLKQVELSALQGGNGVENAAEFFALLDGEGRPAIRDLVIANAAYAWTLLHPTCSLPNAVVVVQDALASGRVKQHFNQFRSATEG
jgi:anthranilate phosphoribosyltransferase